MAATMAAGATPTPKATANARYVLVAVPRGHLAKYSGLPWAELLAAAERGDDGLAITDSKDFGLSYFREGDTGGMLDGRPSLFCQGWVVAS